MCDKLHYIPSTLDRFGKELFLYINNICQANLFKSNSYKMLSKAIITASIQWVGLGTVIMSMLKISIITYLDLVQRLNIFTRSLVQIFLPFLLNGAEINNPFCTLLCRPLLKMSVHVHVKLIINCVQSIYMANYRLSF